jgi:hypothetical protein
MHSMGAMSQRESVEYGDTVMSVPGAQIAQDAARSMQLSRHKPNVAEIWHQLTDRAQTFAPTLKRTVHVGDQAIPIWVLAIAGVVVVGAGIFLFGGLLVAHNVATSSSATASGSGTDDAPKAPKQSEETQKLIAAAVKGDRDALAKLTARPDAQKTAAEWRALGRGNAVVGNTRLSLSAYQKAVGLDASLAKDKELIADVRRAALASATTTVALDFALSSLGATGADLAFDVWSSTKSSKDDADVNKAAKNYIDGNAIRSKATPALLIALDLNKAKTCGDFKDLLPRVEKDADSRSSPKLKKLSERRGCGIFGWGDCYGCLRTGSDLSDAAKAAESRPGPNFG